MTKTDQLKTLDNKIRANKAQYDLDRKNAEISALSSRELEKYEYLTGKDLEIKPDVVSKAKFEYSALGKIFNKGLDESNEKEGLLKRLKNIEDKSKNQQIMIENNKNNQQGVDDIRNNFTKSLSPKGIDILNSICNQEKLINYRKLYFKGGNIFSSLPELLKRIYYGDVAPFAVQRDQDYFNKLIDGLEKQSKG